MPKLKNQRHFAEIITTNALNRHPQAMGQSEGFIRDKASFGPAWPDWCYLPMGATYAILVKDADSSMAETVLGYEGGTFELSLLTAALIWTRFKTVYRFDQTLADELSSQTIVGDIPVDLLRRTPEPCIFIESKSSLLGMEYAGFFAWLEYDTGKSGGTGAELRLLYANQDGSALPYPLILRDTIDNSIVALSESSEKRSGVQLAHSAQEIADFVRGDISAALNKILYLCSEAPDVVSSEPWPQEHRPKVSNKVPSRAATWDVGYRIGSALRKARAEEKMSASTHGGHASPRPHIRRAHWHKFWAGSESVGDRHLLLKWLPPIPVGIVGDEELPTILRPVRKD